MKIKLNDQFLDLRGNPLPLPKMCDCLAEVLAMSTTGNLRKMISWARELPENGEIDVSAADVQFLKTFILNSRLNNLQRAQLLERIQKQAQEMEEKPWRLRITFR